MGKPNKRYPAVFIDRDGTIIREKNYLRKVKDLHIIQGTGQAMEMLRSAGFKLILITNQSGIGRGYLTEKKLLQIHARLQKMLAKEGVSFDAIYYCPHHPDDDCSCRKPKLGLVRKAMNRFKLDLKSSFVIGDHVNDFLLASNMGGKGIFVLTGHGRQELNKIKSSRGELKPDFIARNVLTAARLIIKGSKKVYE